MDKIALRISEILLEANIIKEKDIAVCKYGIVLFLTSVLEVGAVLILSLFAGNFLETVIFFAGFLPIRIYAGGYHANTKLGCFLVLLGTYAVFSVLLMLGNQEIYQDAMIAVPIINIICMYLWSPLLHKNKNLNKSEIKKFRIISLILSAAEGVIIIFLGVYHISNKFSAALLLGLFTALSSLIAGKIKSLIERR